jgi:hypothetical protein
MEAAGELPGAVRVGRRVRCRLAALQQWIDDGCPAPRPKPRGRR